LITEDLAGLRLDKALATMPELNSRSRAAQLIDEGLVRLGSKKPKASHKTSLGEIFEIELPRPKPATLEPYDFPLHIYYEDADLIVINKPAGLVMHPAAGHESDTLVNALLNHTRSLAVGFHEERPGIVHRLDKETSGVLVVAKNDFSLEDLARQFRARTVHRIYYALVHGEVKNPAGTIQSYLRRHPADRKRFASEKLGPKQEPRGKRAVTHFTRLKAYPCGISKVRCRLETGRTHQIRIHMSEMGHPILGDDLYGSASRLNSIKNLAVRKLVGGMNRIALHAAELGFTHPRSGEKMSFEAPWPEDLAEILRLLE
jgi:23S rRNA pseudouridine1911/1915/1917 synthase